MNGEVCLTPGPNTFIMTAGWKLWMNAALMRPSIPGVPEDVYKRQKPVSLLDLDELTKTIEKQYEMIISDNIFEINKMELYMMAQKNTKNSYDIFPVWILFMEQIHTDGKKEIRTPMQNVINAETGEIIS